MSVYKFTKISFILSYGQTTSYSNATDNFKVEKIGLKSAQNSRKWCAKYSSLVRSIFIYWRRFLTTLVEDRPTVTVTKM